MLIPEPSFVCYKPLTQMAGGVPVPLPTRAEDQFKLTGGQSARRYYAAHQAAHPAVPEQPDRRDHDAR